MKEAGRVFAKDKNRRLFLKTGVVAAGAATVGAVLFAGKASAFDDATSTKSAFSLK